MSQAESCQPAATAGGDALLLSLIPPTSAAFPSTLLRNSPGERKRSREEGVKPLIWKVNADGVIAPRQQSSRCGVPAHNVPGYSSTSVSLFLPPLLFCLPAFVAKGWSWQVGFWELSEDPRERERERTPSERHHLALEQEEVFSGLSSFFEATSGHLKAVGGANSLFVLSGERFTSLSLWTAAVRALLTILGFSPPPSAVVWVGSGRLLTLRSLSHSSTTSIPGAVAALLALRRLCRFVFPPCG